MKLEPEKRGVTLPPGVARRLDQGCEEQEAHLVVVPDALLV